MENSLSPASSIAPIFLVILSDDEHYAARLSECLRGNHAFQVDCVGSMELVLRKLLAKTVDIIIAALHADQVDSLVLPYWICELDASGQLSKRPHIIWVAANGAPEHSVQNKRSLSEDGRDIICTALSAHAYLARDLGLAVTLTRNDDPAHLIQVLDGIAQTEQSRLFPPESIGLHELPSDEDVILTMTTGDNLRVVLQPQYALASRRIVGAEAMIRWFHPRLGEIPLSLLIPMVDRLGLDLLLFSYIENTVIDILGELERSGITIPIAVNASARTLCATGLAARLAARMEKAGLSTRRLKIELTEQLPPDSELLLSAAMMELRVKGFRISLDDFGADSATLALLGHIPFDELKIDRTLIRGVAHSRQAEKVVSAIVNLAHLFDLELVVEGIEDPSCIETLIRLGCTTGQGFALERPLERGAFLKLLMQESETGTLA